MSRVEEKDALADYEAAWFANPITRKNLKLLIGERQSAVAKVINAGSSSVDPDVRAAVTKFRTLDALVQRFGGSSYSDEVKRGED